MGHEQICERIGFLLWGTNKYRFEVISTSCGEAIIIDLHGLTKIEVNKLLKNVIAILPFSFELVLIHGYNHGTVLKEFIWYEMNNKRIENRKSLVGNPGITLLNIA